LRFVSALRVRILTGPQGISLSALRIFEISCASTFYGLLLPGDLAGGVVRWYKLSRPDRKPTEVLVVMVVDRILDTVLLILIGVVFWAIDARLTVAAPRVFLTLGGTVAVLLLITAAILDRRLSRFWIRLAGSRRVPRILRRRLDVVRDSVLRIQQLPKISLAKFLALMMARHALGLLSLYLLAAALGMSLTFVQVGSIRSAMLIVTLLPVTVSGLGVREASLVFLCGHYGAVATDALAWSLLIFSGLIVVALIGGVGELRNAWSRRRRTEGTRARR
jgi:uncharacterized protein (TIRG00374 family)